MPHSLFEILWNSAKIISVSIIFILIPVPISFNFHLGDYLEPNLDILIVLFVAFSSLDIVIKFNSAFFSRGTLVRSRIEIARSYLKSEFLLDLATILAFLLYVEEKSLAMWPVLLLFYGKIFEMKRILIALEENTNFSAQGEGFIQIVKLLFKILFIAHVCGCLWHFTATLLLGSRNTWLSTIDGLEKGEWMVRYVYSFYWATTTIVTVGYGDIIPKNEFEVLVSILVILIGCGVFAYSLNSLGTIISDMNRDQHEFTLKIVLL